MMPLDLKISLPHAQFIVYGDGDGIVFRVYA